MKSVRWITPEIGKSATVKQCPGAYQLPVGLEELTPVMVVGWEMPCFLVRTEDGRQWKLHQQNVDRGMEYQVERGEWVRDNDPRVLDWMEHELRRLSEQPNPGAWCGHNEYVTVLRECLKRHGRV